MAIRSLIAAGLLCFTATSALADGHFPVSVMDDRGKIVTVKEKPKAVAAVSVFGADLLQKLGGKAVAVTTFGGKLPDFLGDGLKGVADLGGRTDANLEIMREKNVDMTIAIRRYTEHASDEFEAVGDYLAYDTISFQDSDRAIQSASAALGYGSQGLEINDKFDDLITEMHEKAPGKVSAMFLWYWEDTLYGYYDHYMTVALQKVLKADNPFGASPTPHANKPFAGAVSFEQLLAYDPDVLFIYRAPGQDIAPHPVFKRLKANKNKRIWRVKHQYPEVHGPIAREQVLKEMAHLLYPDIFAKPELPKGAEATLVAFD